MNELKQTKFWGFNIKNSGFVNFQAPSMRDIGPSSGERSGSCSGEMLKMPKGFDLERPAAATATATAAHEEDMSTGVSAIDEDQTGLSTHMPRKLSGINIDEKCSDVELTLSIGGSIGEKRSQSHKQHCSLKLDDLRDVDSSGFIKTVKGEEFSDSDNTNMASSSTNFNQKSKQPHWIFQDLSLSRT